jgi:hypothetical protein
MDTSSPLPRSSPSPQPSPTRAEEIGQWNITVVLIVLLGRRVEVRRKGRELT